MPSELSPTLLFWVVSQSHCSVPLDPSGTPRDGTHPPTSVEEVAEEEAKENHMIWEEYTTSDDEGTSSSSSSSKKEQILSALGPPKSPFWRSKIIEHSTKSWDAFYKRHGEGFFLSRNYLDRDFPCLQAALHAPFTLLEFGCGTGASLLPLLDRLPHLHATGFDLSAHAIALANRHPITLANASRACFFAGDATHPLDSVQVQVARAHEGWAASGVGPARPPSPPLHEQGFHAVLLLFCLSAIAPETQGATLARAAQCLRPGGVLLLRDYGEGDEAQLRFGVGAKLEEDGSVMVRRDGTLAAFLALKDLKRHCAEAGLQEAGAGECRYLKRKYSNRATGQVLKRVFVHGVWRKPWGGVVRG